MGYPFAKVLVTGGAGFIGSQLLPKLLQQSGAVIVIDDCSTGRREQVPDSAKLTFIEASYVNETLLDRVLPGVTHIYHLACRNLVLSAEQMDDDFRVNLYGGYLLLKKAKEHCPQLRRFVYTSTASVYGNAAVLPTPESSYQTTVPYAASKLSMEHYCKVYSSMYHVPVSVLRLSNVYGPGQVTANPYCGVVSKFFETAARRLPFRIYGDGTQTRDYTYIEDAIEALMLAGRHPNAVGHVYNVGTGVETSVNELARAIADLSGISAPQLSYCPKRPVDVVHRRCLQTKRIYAMLGWEAKTSLEDGLRKTGLWAAGGATG